MNQVRSEQSTSFLQRLNQLLVQNAGDPDFGIQELCQSLFMSRSSLHRKITAESGTSIAIYVRDFRLNRAYQLLQYRNQTIRSIALESGFWDVAYFCKCFKIKFGVTPTEVKNQYLS